MNAGVLSAEEERSISEALQSDPGFWTVLSQDPKAAYKARFGKELAAGQEILVEQASSNRATFVSATTGRRLLVEYAASGELRDDQLATVVGGVGVTPSGVGDSIIRLGPPRFTHY